MESTFAAQQAALARTAAAPYQNALQPVPSACTNGLERHLQKEGTELIVSDGLLAATGGLPVDGYPDSVVRIDASANRSRACPRPSLRHSRRSRRSTCPKPAPRAAY